MEISNQRLRNLTTHRLHTPSHDGITELPEPSAGDRHQMLQVYLSQPDPLAGKDVLVVKI